MSDPRPQHHCRPDQAIRVHGLDVCLHPDHVEDLAAYLADVDPAYAVQARDLLAPLRERMHVLPADPDRTAAASRGLAVLRAQGCRHREPAG